MRKLAIAFAAAAVLVLVAAPVSHAAGKKLWEGWIEEMQKAHAGIMAKAGVK